LFGALLGIVVTVDVIADINGCAPALRAGVARPRLGLCQLAFFVLATPRCSKR
jgi:hypothetical protein